MRHKPGTYLGSVRNLKSLRERCVMGEGGCWHLRSARGRPMPKDRRHPIWVFGIGVMTATRAAWLFNTGSLPVDGHVVFRTCPSYDCVNPKHLGCGPKAEHGKAQRTIGNMQGQWHRIRANIANGQARRKLTHELAQWARESSQPATAIAHALGIAVSRAIDVKAGRCWKEGAAGSSVFNVKVPR